MLHSKYKMHQSSTFRFFLPFLITAMVCCHFQCAYNTNQFAAVHNIYDPEKQLSTRLMVGNSLPLNPLEAMRLIKVSLDPGIVRSVDGSSYAFIKLVCVSRLESNLLQPDDSLLIQMDGRELLLLAYAKNVKNRQTDTYYAIDRLDLIELGNSKKVNIVVTADPFDFKKTLDEQTIINFRKFSHEVILSQKPRYREKEKKKRGFIGVGKGNVYQVVGGYYTNLLKDKPVKGISDFIAIGLGQSSFDYDVYKLYQVNTYPVVYRYYYYLHRINKSNHAIALWGISYQKPSWIASLELAASINYYYLKDPYWNEYIPYQTEIGTLPFFINIHRGGKIHKGWAVGAFLQAGPLWYHIDTKSVWTIGLSLPIKF
jgi:hypothetical protein